MVGKGSSGLGVDTGTGSKERPVFIPPRKRQQTKSEAKKQNYVDHIVSVQVSKLKITVETCSIFPIFLKHIDGIDFSEF